VPRLLRDRNHTPKPYSTAFCCFRRKYAAPDDRALIEFAADRCKPTPERFRSADNRRPVKYAKYLIDDAGDLS